MCGSSTTNIMNVIEINGKRHSCETSILLQQKKIKNVGHDSANGYEVGRGMSLVSEALK
jgi:hypothetical protein